MVETALKKLAEDKVKYVELWFVDILGQLKTFTVPVEEIEKAFAEGIGFDGSSVEGFAR
ncbi:MAG TPA: glutamine synthetase, partial [bacterium]|nr:glutamine synthetase [bacterium]